MPYSKHTKKHSTIQPFKTYKERSTVHLPPKGRTRCGIDFVSGARFPTSFCAAFESVIFNYSWVLTAIFHALPQADPGPPIARPLMVQILSPWIGQWIGLFNNSIPISLFCFLFEPCCLFS